MRIITEMKETGFTFDTCVILKICQGDKNFTNLLKCRINFHGSTINLNSQIIDEMNRHGFDCETISKTLSSQLGTHVNFYNVSDDVFSDALYMRRIYPTLHAGDDQILAFAIANNSTLVTCDKGLVEAAKLAGANFVNPDLLPCDETIKVKKSRWGKIVKNMIIKSPNSAMVIKSKLLKPGKKIVWRSFQ